MASRAVRFSSAAALLALVASRTLTLEGQDQPVFHSGVDLVTVDVSVVGSDGRPVEGLTAEQFQVVVDGIPRRVLSGLDALRRQKRIRRSALTIV